VDHVGHALPAHRLDGKVDVLEREAVGSHLVQCKPSRCQLRERQFARAVRVPARALEGDRLGRDALEREVGELLELALHNHRAGLALQSFDSQKYRKGPGAGRAIEHDVDPFAAGDLLDSG
jgi:hypothetical protein